MRGDFSRFTFNRKKHYSGVRMQQGRVQLDSDWNEQLDIQAYLQRTESKDVIGLCGAPHTGGGFDISVTPGGGEKDFIISPGRFYVDGILCELDDGSGIRVLSSSGNKVELNSRFADGREFEPGQWIEIRSEGKEPLVTRITDVDVDNKILILESGVSGYDNASLRRVATYMTQPGYTQKDYLTITSFPEGGNQAHLKSLVINGETLQEGRLVEMYAENRVAKIVRITKVYKRSNTLTFDKDVSEYDESLNPRLCHLPNANRNFLNLPSTAGECGIYLAYLDVWEQHITMLEDPDIREVALGGPDTATRTKTISQVKLLLAGNVDDNVNCISEFSSWNNIVADNHGRMRARVAPESSTDDSCVVPPRGGYSLIENQLCRVEVHKSGKLGGEAEPDLAPTFKWSTDNGLFAGSVQSIFNNGLTVVDSGRGPQSELRPGQWIELTDEELTLSGKTGILAELKYVEGNVLTVTEWPDNRQPAMDDFKNPPIVRAWDRKGESKIEVQTENEGWIKLGGGIEVKFEEGDYFSGDYWLIPARVNTKNIEWPEDDNKEPLSQIPYGIKHHYCRLALLKYAVPESSNESEENTENAGSGEPVWTKLNDCRRLFSPLTDPDLVYLSGDGQEAMPGDILPYPLTIQVVNCHEPVKGVRVRFEIAKGNGVLQLKDEENAEEADLFVIETDRNGQAHCFWRLPTGYKDGNGKFFVQQTRVVLLDAQDKRLGLPVLFGATFSVAETVAYEGSPFPDRDADTVEEAIDQLRQNYSLYHVSGDGQEAMPGEELPKPLQVRVANGQWPKDGAKVRFQIINGSGTGKLLSINDRKVEPDGDGNYIVTTTNERGLAECGWNLDEEMQSQQVEAILLDDADEPVLLPIRFNANLSRASGVAYSPPQKCELFMGASSVKEALDNLCEIEAGDVAYNTPDCVKGESSLPTVKSLMEKTVEAWPNLDKDEKTTVKDILDSFLCHLDAGNIPLREGMLAGSPLITIQTALENLISKNGGVDGCVSVIRSLADKIALSADDDALVMDARRKAIKEEPVKGSDSLLGCTVGTALDVVRILYALLLELLDVGTDDKSLGSGGSMNIKNLLLKADARGGFARHMEKRGLAIFALRNHHEKFQMLFFLAAEKVLEDRDITLDSLERLTAVFVAEAGKNPPGGDTNYWAYNGLATRMAFLKEIFKPLTKRDVLDHIALKNLKEVVLEYMAEVWRKFALVFFVQSPPAFDFTKEEIKKWEKYKANLEKLSQFLGRAAGSSGLVMGHTKSAGNYKVLLSSAINGSAGVSWSLNPGGQQSGIYMYKNSEVVKALDMDSLKYTIDKNDLVPDFPDSSLVIRPPKDYGQFTDAHVAGKYLALTATNGKSSKVWVIDRSNIAAESGSHLIDDISAKNTFQTDSPFAFPYVMGCEHEYPLFMELTQESGNGIVIHNSVNKTIIDASLKSLDTVSDEELDMWSARAYTLSVGPKYEDQKHLLLVIDGNNGQQFFIGKTGATQWWSPVKTEETMELGVSIEWVSHVKLAAGANVFGALNDQIIVSDFKNERWAFVPYRDFVEGGWENNKLPERDGWIKTEAGEAASIFNIRKGPKVGIEESGLDFRKGSIHNISGGKSDGLISVSSSQNILISLYSNNLLDIYRCFETRTPDRAASIPISIFRRIWKISDIVNIRAGVQSARQFFHAVERQNKQNKILFFNSTSHSKEYLMVDIPL